MKPQVRARRALTSRNGSYAALQSYVQLRTLGWRLWQATVLMFAVAMGTVVLVVLYALVIE